MLSRSSIYFSTALLVISFSSTVTAGIIGDIDNDGQISLTEAIYALQVSSGAYPNLNTSCQLTGRGGWSSAVAYNECDVITYDGSMYACNTAHTSASFISDQSNWSLLTQAEPVAGINKQVIFNDNGMASGAEIYFDKTSEKIGVGTDTPVASLHILKESPDNASLRLETPGNTTSSNIIGRKAGGSKSSPEPVVDEFTLLGIEGEGYDGDSYEVGARIVLEVDGVVSDGVVPGRIKFLTSGSDGNLSSNVLIDSTGNVGIGTESPEYLLHISREAGESHSLLLEAPAQPGMQFREANENGDTWSVNSYNGNLNFDSPSRGEQNRKVIIKSDGNVGIGTYTPLSKLAVSGLPTSPPDASGNAGVVCVTNNGNFWLDNDGTNDCI